MRCPYCKKGELLLTYAYGATSYLCTKCDILESGNQIIKYIKKGE